MVAGAAGLLFILFRGGLFWAALKMSPASAEVEGMARAYLGIRIWGAPAAISVYALTGWLIAMERGRSVLFLQLWMNVLNIVLDLAFVLGMGWGVEGVAVATLIAEWTGAFFGLWLCRDAFAGRAWKNWARVFDRERLRKMASVNGDIMVRSILLQGAFMLFIFRGAAFGDLTLAANQILLQFLEITAYALDGFAFTAEAMVGQALGARTRHEFRRAAVLSSQWAAGASVVLAAFFALAGGSVITLMATSPEVQEAALKFLPWVVAGPLIGLPSWMLDGVFIGATRTRDMRNAMIQSTVVYAVALVIGVHFWGNHGLWGALMVLNTTRALTLWSRYPALERSVAGTTSARGHVRMDLA